MKVSITLDFESPDHAIVALNHIDELRKGNFGETTAAPTDGGTAKGSAEPTPKATKPRKPRKSKADKPTDTKEATPHVPDTPPDTSVPSLADVQEVVKGIFKTKGAVAALELLKTMGVGRAAELPDDQRAEFIAKAKKL